MFELSFVREVLTILCFVLDTLKKQHSYTLLMASVVAFENSSLFTAYINY